MPGGISYIGDMSVVESGGEITSQSVGDKALKSSAADTTSIEVSSTTGKLGIVEAGSSLANGLARDQSSKYNGHWLQGSLTASDAAAGVFQERNTYGTVLIITRVLIYVSTIAGDTCTLDIGVGAGASTSYNTLIDGLDVRTSTGAFGNIKDKGTDGEEVHLWGTSEYVNASMATGATSGLAGKYAIHVIDINA